MLNGIGSTAAWSIFARKGEELSTRFTNRRDNQAEIARFREAAANIGSIEELMRDRRTLTFVLTSFQLESEVGKTAIVRRLLTENPRDEASFANRMADPRYRELNAAFGGREGRPLANPALVDRIIAGAMTNRFEMAAGEGNSGLREALYFRRNAASINSVSELMSSRPMTTVMIGALGLPQQFGLLSFEQQRDLLEKRVDFNKLKDPAEVNRLVQRYLMRSGQESTSNDPRLALFSQSQQGTTGLMGLLGRGLSIRV
jgi:hypothetical protein